MDRAYLIDGDLDILSKEDAISAFELSSAAVLGFFCREKKREMSFVCFYFFASFVLNEVTFRF